MSHIGAVPEVVKRRTANNGLAGREDDIAEPEIRAWPGYGRPGVTLGERNRSEGKNQPA
jgi:hypothetical protein